METIDKVSRGYAKLTIDGLLATMYDSRTLAAGFWPAWLMASATRYFIP